MIEPLPEKLPEALMGAAAHPGDADAAAGVEHIQTHISHVFLTKYRVYKLRKAVDLGFLCFAERAQRNADCLNELRLNRRLAPAVYLGIAPITHAAGGGWQIGPTEENPSTLRPDREHCVVMRRLPAGRDALTLLEAGTLRDEQLDRVAARLARFHRASGLGAPSPFDREQWLARIAEPIEANFEAVERAGEVIVAPVELDALRTASQDAMTRLAACFEQRRLEGRAVDGHGDLHLQHIWLSEDDADPLVIDCLEFSESLRRIDAASELAFLAMDLGYRGAGRQGERVLSRYALESDDYGLYDVVDFYVAYRAAVRGKVAAIAASDDEIEDEQRAAAAQSARRHVYYALRALAPKPPGPVILVGGPVGVGKTSVARAVADLAGAVPIASDRVRKARAGLAPSDRLTARSGEGAYTDERRARVYEELLERAAPVIGSGRAALLDATWATRALRDEARAWAVDRDAPCFFIEVGCDPRVAMQRLEARTARGDDASDAGPELVEASARAFEAPEEWPRARRLTVHTDEPDWQTRLPAQLAALNLPPTAGLPAAADSASPSNAPVRDQDGGLQHGSA